MVPVTTGRPTVVLDEVNIPAYLQRRGLLGPEEDAAVDRLQGGYVNNVFRADCGQRARGPGESPAKIFILKQSLEAAQRTVLAADIGRGLVEVAAMKTIAGLLGPLAPIPTILDDGLGNTGS